MNCPYCGHYTKENQKFCTKCGAKILDEKPVQSNTNPVKNNKIMILIISLVILFSGICTCCVVKNSTNTRIAYELKTPTQVLSKIDELQAQYFSIIKRNDVLLQVFDSEEYQQDTKDLDKLFAEVERNIAKDNYYLQKYHEIEKKYQNNPGMNTYDMNMFAEEHYKAVDKLLNEVYQEVHRTIPQEDFKPLITSELRWLKDVESYRKVYESMDFGSIGTLKYLGYEINMRNFRTLLLMLYL